MSTPTISDKEIEKMDEILSGYESTMVKIDDELKEEMWERGCVHQAMQEYASLSCKQREEEIAECNKRIIELVLERSHCKDELDSLKEKFLEVSVLAAEYKEENERLKGLEIKLYNYLYDQFWRRHHDAGISEKDIQKSWQQFKQENNL